MYCYDYNVIIYNHVYVLNNLDKDSQNHAE